MACHNLVDEVDGFLMGKRFLILDRDPVYTVVFRHLLKGAGVRVVRLPARSPSWNAFAERFVRSIREEYPNHLVLLGERQLQTARSGTSRGPWSRDGPS